MGSRRPLVVTMGEPGGVGPELITKLWQDVRGGSQPFCIAGSPKAFKAISPDLPIAEIRDPDECDAVFAQSLPLINTGELPSIIPGTLIEGTQHATINAIDKAVDLARREKVAGIVTAPIHKAHLMKAGFKSLGHTDYLAELCDLPTSCSVMMLATQDLRVVPVTVHIPLADVSRTLTHTQIIETALVVQHDLKNRFGLEKPRIAVAGLNPHGGEGGLIGHEEATHIIPAIRVLKEDYGLNIGGPYAADTMFHADARKGFDAALCMYHDQALIPVKTLDFWGGVNVTLGLPIIRTSPDHGTALAQAGKGTANPESMRQAFFLAADMAETAKKSAML